MAGFEQKSFFDNAQRPEMDVLTLIREVLHRTETPRFEDSFKHPGLIYIKDAIMENWLLPFKIVEIDGANEIALEFVPVDIAVDGDLVIIENVNGSEAFFTPESMIGELAGYDKDTVVKFRAYDDDKKSYKDYTITGTRTVLVTKDGAHFVSLKFDTIQFLRQQKLKCKVIILCT